MESIHPFVRIPGGAPYSDYNTDRGVAEQITSEACRLLVADHDCDLDEEQRFHGSGRIEYDSGLVYEGDLAHGRATGRGKLVWPSGETYEGTVRNGRAWGEGHMEWPNGTTYEGSMLDGKRHGFGVLVAASGARYEGEWSAGKREGRGRLVYGVAVGEDGQRVVNEYVGQFKADRRHGVGTLRFASGSVYEGQWVADRKAGQGVMVWPASGQVYKGGWADDQPDGQGVSVWERTGTPGADEPSADASRRPMCTRYEGGFRAGVRHGVGTLFYADGAKYTGTWRAGLKEGLGVMVSADGAVYEGVFEADRPRDGPTRRADAPPSPRTTERQTAYSLHVDDVITGALPSVKARGGGSLAGPAGAALAGLSAARAAGGAVLSGGGVGGGRGLALATRRDATATQNVLSRWLPLLRRWYDAACVEGSTAMGGPLEIADGEGKPARVVSEARTTAAQGSEQGHAEGRSEVPGLALRTLATLGELDNEEEEEDDELDDELETVGRIHASQASLPASRGIAAAGTASLPSRASLAAGDHAVERKDDDDEEEEEEEVEEASVAGGSAARRGGGSLAGSDSGSRPSLRIGALSQQSEAAASAGELDGVSRDPAEGSGARAGVEPGSARSEGLSLTGRQAAMGVTPMRAHKLAAMGPSDASRSAGADPVAVASAGVFAMPQRGLWRVARAMGLLRPPVSTAVVDRVLLLVRARHVRRALAGLETTREREMPASGASSPQAGARAASAGDGGQGLDPARKSVSVGLLPSPVARSSSRSGMSVGGAAPADGSFAEPQSPVSAAPPMQEPLTDAEFSQLRARIAAPLAGPRHDPARPVLFREFLEVVVRLCRILYSGGRRPPTDPAALEAAAQQRQQEAAAIAAQQSLASTFFEGGGFAPSSGQASPMVSGSASVAGPLPLRQTQAWDSAAGGIRALLFRPDALAGLDTLAPALRVLFLRYSVPDDGPAMVPTSVDPGSLAGMVADCDGSAGALAGTLAAARTSVHGRVVSGHGLLRMVRDAGLVASDFGAEQVAVLMHRSLFDMAGVSGRADMGATCGGLAADQVTTGVVAPKREVAEAEAAAEEEDDNVAIADCGLVLVPDEEDEAAASGLAGVAADATGLDDAACETGGKDKDPASTRSGAGAGGAGAKASAGKAGSSRGSVPRSESAASPRGPGTARSAASSSQTPPSVAASATASAATSTERQQRKLARDRAPVGPSLPDLGAEATAADWPLILTRLMLALLRLAPRRAAGAAAHERRWAEAKKALEVAAEAKVAAAAKAAEEAAAANKKAKKKPAKKGAPVEPEPVFEAEPVTAAQIEALVGPPPSLPLLLPGASAPASAQEVRDCGAAPGQTPIARGRGAPLAEKLQVFLSTVLLRRLAVPGFTEAFARADPLSEAGNGGRLSARRSSRSPRTGLSAAEAAAASAAAAMEVAKLR